MPLPSRFEQAARNYLVAVAANSRNTSICYAKPIRDALKIGDGQLTAEAILRYVDWLNEQELSPSTVSNRLTGLHRFALYLQEIGLYPEGKLPLPLLRRPKVQRVRVAYLTEGETRRLWKASDGTTRLAVLLLSNLGLRVSELVDAQWGHLYRERGRIGLVVKGKGQRQRIVPLPDFIFRVLQGQRRKAKLPVDLDVRDKRPLVWKPTGEKYGRKHIGALITRAAKRAGINKRVGPHTLRHTCATTLLNAGGNIVTVKELLGHATIKTTEIYVHTLSSPRNSSTRLVSKRIFGRV